jgi:hypothetical protein
MNHNGHNLHNASNLQNWIEHELIHLAALDEEEVVEINIPDRSLSLRIPITTHLMLYRIAQKLSRSKTAGAEEILHIAVKDVYRQLELPPLTVQDIEEYAVQTEKALPEKTMSGRTSVKKG